MKARDIRERYRSWSDHDREDFWHRVVAGSAFLCALSSVPLLHAIFVAPAPSVSLTDGNKVAGASTAAPAPTPTSDSTTSIVLADLPSDPALCEKAKADELARIQGVVNGMRTYFYSKYILHPQSDTDGALYTDKIHELDSLLSDQKASLDAKSCR